LRCADAVFLDVGWTMTYPRESMWDVFAAVCAEAGSPVTSEKIEAYVHDFLLSRRGQAIEELEKGSEYPDSDAEFLSIFLSMSRLVFSFAGLDGDRHEVLAGEFLDRFWDRANWHVFPDVVPALKRLRARGVRLGIISNASSELADFLKKIGLFPLFDFVCISAVEGVRKPGRRIYEKALELAAVDPSRAVHVGDMLLEDVLGPSKLGIRPFLIDRGPRSMFPRHPERPDPWIQTRVEVVRSLHEVTSALEV
jgi:HAD superfamily hydrolase (TIGR01549 family)